MARMGLLARSISGLALGVAFMLAPQAAMAQEDPGEIVGVYRTEPMENEITGETIVREITLFDDTSAESVTQFLKAGSTNYEVGGWYPTPEGTAVVTLVASFDYRGGRQRALEPPVEITFAADGESLIAEDYLMYGPGDLILNRTEDEPESFLDEEGELRMELREGLVEFPDSLFIGDYRSQDFEIEGKEGWLRLILQEDGAARMEYPAGLISDEAVASEARWYNFGDGTLGVNILADLDAAGEELEAYDPPEPFSVMNRLESGGLVVRDVNLPDGGQLIFSRTDEGEANQEVASAAGYYASLVPASDDTVIGAIVSLGEDGAAQMVYVAFDGQTVPISAIGRWEQEGEVVTITFTHEIDKVSSGAKLRRTDTYSAETFTAEDGRLVGEEVTLFPVPLPAQPQAEASAEEEPESESSPAAPPAEPAENATYMVSREELRAGNTIVLSLMGDGTAAMSAQRGANAPTSVELGSWSEEDGDVTVTLTRGVDNVDYDEPRVLVFKRTDERTLTGIEYDESLYGEELVLFDTRDY